jgi:hypothetical protein
LSFALEAALRLALRDVEPLVLPSFSRGERELDQSQCVDQNGERQRCAAAFDVSESKAAAGVRGFSGGFPMRGSSPDRACRR